MNPRIPNDTVNWAQIWDTVSSGLILIDADGTVRLWNDWVADHSGIPAASALGHPLESLFAKEASQAFKDAIQNALAHKLPIVLSHALHRAPLPLYPLPFTPQQQRLQQSITITPLTDHNRFHCLVQIADASIWLTRENMLAEQSERQKRMAQRLRVLFEQASVGVAEIDTATGRFLQVNHKYSDIVGYDQEEMLALDFMAITHPDDLAPDLAKMARLTRGELREFTLEKRLLHKNGSTVWVDLSVSPLWGPGESPTQHIAIVKDITERMQAEMERRNALTLLTDVINTTPDFIFVKDRDLRTILCNNVFAQSIGKTPRDMIGHTDIENGWDPELVQGNPAKGIRGFETDDREVLHGRTIHIPAEPVSVGGEILTFETDKVPLLSDTGEVMGVLGIARDITARKQAETKIAQTIERLNLATSAAQLGVWDWDIANNVLVWDDRMFALFGLQREEVSDSHDAWLASVHPDDQARCETALLQALRKEQPYEVEFRIRWPNGNERVIKSVAKVGWDTDGTPLRVTGVNVDITEQKLAEQRILQMAFHDMLTGLPNRRLLQDRIAQALAHARRNKNKIAVLFIDLDHFKPINDLMGHDAGDLLLKEVAARLSASVRAEDTVARQGGDEFIVLLSKITNAQDAEAVAGKILARLTEPFQIKGKELQIGGSLGIALFPSDGEDADTLLKNSDTAMYYAKQNGRNNYQLYRAGMNKLATEGHSIQAQSAPDILHQ